MKLRATIIWVGTYEKGVYEPKKVAIFTFNQTYNSKELGNAIQTSNVKAADGAFHYDYAREIISADF